MIYKKNRRSFSCWMQTGNSLCRGDGYFLVPVELHNQHLSLDFLFLFVFVKKINKKIESQKKSTCSLGSTVLVELETFEPCSGSLPLNPPPPPLTTSQRRPPPSKPHTHFVIQPTFGAKQQKPQDVSGTSAVRPQTIFFYWEKKKKPHNIIGAAFYMHAANEPRPLHPTPHRRRVNE